MKASKAILIAAVSFLLSLSHADAGLTTLYDDFSGSSLDATKWDLHEAGTSEYGINLTEQAFHTVVSDQGNAGTILRMKRLIYPGESVEYDLDYVSGTGNNIHHSGINDPICQGSWEDCHGAWGDLMDPQCPDCYIGFWNSPGRGGTGFGRYKIRMDFSEASMLLSVREPGGAYWNETFELSGLDSPYQLDFASETGHDGLMHMDLDNFRIISGCSVAYWRFNEGSGDTAKDETGQHDGSISGAQYAQGVEGTGLLFDGGDYVEVPDHDGLTFPEGNFTIESYFKLDKEHTYGSSPKWILLKNGEYGIYLGDDGFLYFYIASGHGIPTTYKSSGINDWEAGRWYHVAVVFENGKAWRIYIDHSLAASGDQDYYPMVTDKDLLIGAFDIGFFKGTLDAIRISGCHLTPSEFLDFPPPASLKLMEWTFDSDPEGWVASPEISDPPARYCIWEDSSIGGYAGNPPGSILCASCLTSVPSDEFCTYDGCSEIHNEITLPQEAERLTFETSGSWPLYGVNPLYDGGLILKIKDESGAWHILYDDCLAIDTSTWLLKSIDISSFAGQKVTLRFEQSEKDCGSGQVCNVEVRRIDNVIIWGEEITSPCNCSEQNQRISNLEGNLTELKERVNSLESAIATIQSSVSLLQQGLDAFKSLVLAYLSNAPLLTKQSMICGYMKDNNLKNYSALGLSCEIKGWFQGKPFLEWKHCKCK
jgi:hypothetical protein